MKSKLLILLACLLIGGINLPAQSNIGGKLKDKLVNKLKSKGEQKADQAIDSAVDKPVDKTEQKVKESVKNSGDADSEGASSTKNSSTNSSGAGSPSEAEIQQMMENMGLGNMGGAVTIEDYPDLDEVKPSPWVGSFDMITSGTDKNGKPLLDEDGKVSWFIEKFDVAMLPDVKVNGKQQAARMIVKRKQGIMLMLTDDNGKKQGIVMKLKTISVDLSDTDFDEELSDIKVEVQRGVTQVVNGQKCFKVRAWNDEFESISWVKDFGLSFQDLMGFMNIKSEGKSEYEDKFGHINGIPIKTTTTDKMTGDVIVMEIQNLYSGDPNPAMFSDAGYPLMELPDFGGMGGFGGYGAE